MYQQPPPTEQEISLLPLEFALLGQNDQDFFADSLISIWIALAESGSLATLPPVPDIVGFVDTCAVFYLIYHTQPALLKLPPGARLTPPSCPSSPPPSFSSPKSSPSKASKRVHPYANATRPSSSFASSSRTLVDLTQDDDIKPDPTLIDKEIIGCVYLAYNQAVQNAADIGIALRPEARGRGYGRAAITHILRVAFERLRVHRVVANVFGPNPSEPRRGAKDSGTVRWIFEKFGFTPEGVQRLAGFSAADGVWRDVYPLSMLDLDWLNLCHRTTGKASITSPWEAMIERHNEERDQMMEWMDHPSWNRLRRVSSTETIKGATMDTDAEGTDTDEGESTSVDKGKRKASPVIDSTGWTAPEPEPDYDPLDYYNPDDYADPFNTPPEVPKQSSPPGFEVDVSDNDWRSVTPSTDFSVVSHSPPPDSPFASTGVGSPRPSTGLGSPFTGVGSPGANLGLSSPPSLNLNPPSRPESDFEWHTDSDFDTDDFDSLDGASIRSSNRLIGGNST